MHYSQYNNNMPPVWGSFSKDKVKFQQEQPTNTIQHSDRSWVKKRSYSFCVFTVAFSACCCTFISLGYFRVKECLAELDTLVWGARILTSQ